MPGLKIRHGLLEISGSVCTLGIDQISAKIIRCFALTSVIIQFNACITNGVIL